MTSLEVEGLDAAGRSLRWSTCGCCSRCSPEELASWLRANGLGSGLRARRAWAASSCGARRRAGGAFSTGGRVAPNQWVLGPADAPYHFHDAKTWQSAAQVPGLAFHRACARGSSSGTSRSATRTTAA